MIFGADVESAILYNLAASYCLHVLLFLLRMKGLKYLNVNVRFVVTCHQPKLLLLLYTLPFKMTIKKLSSL